MIAIYVIFLSPFVLLTICFTVEVFVGLSPLPPSRLSVSSCAAVIIVPAHNEELVIGKSLKQLKEAAGENPVLVVADNCTDRTAVIARELGAHAIERYEEDRRGKGFALHFAREYLKSDPPDVVLIVDADCTIDAQSISTLIRACDFERVPCQATNLQKPSEGASTAVQLSTFAFFIKNVIRQRALQRLTGKVHLLGTGMALPWNVFETAKLATGDIVEDLKLGLEVTEAGYPPRFVEEAAVWSSAETDTNTLSQRSRWEGGFLANAFAEGPGLLVRAVRSKDIRSIWSAIDVVIPPFALLISLDMLILSLAVAAMYFTATSVWPILVLISAMILAAVSLGLAWRLGGSRFISAAGLLRIPLYIAWKLPMYLLMARRGAPSQWKRTERT